MIENILETDRLILREFTFEDSSFMLGLVNTPSFLKFIGDKKVRSVDDAKEYLRTGYIQSYRENGFGIWLVLEKSTNKRIGTCGLVNRPALEDIDIGFALMPEYEGMGFGFEMASATMLYAKETLNIDRVVGITDVQNVASARLLNKVGLEFERMLELSPGDHVMLLTPRDETKERPLVNAMYKLQKFPGKGGWTYADIPEIPSDRSNHFGWVRVHGFIDDFELVQYKLMPKGNGLMFLPVKAAIRKKIKKEEGDWVHVQLFADERPKGLTKELTICFEHEAPELLERFSGLSVSQQKTYLDWIYDAKTEEDKAHRIVEMMEKLS